MHCCRNTGQVPCTAGMPAAVFIRAGAGLQQYSKLKTVPCRSLNFAAARTPAIDFEGAAAIRRKGCRHRVRLAAAAAQADRHLAHLRQRAVVLSQLLRTAACNLRQGRATHLHTPAHLAAVAVGEVCQRGGGKRAGRGRKRKAQCVQQRRLAATVGPCMQDGREQDIRQGAHSQRRPPPCIALPRQRTYDGVQARIEAELLPAARHRLEGLEAHSCDVRHDACGWAQGVEQVSGRQQRRRQTTAAARVGERRQEARRVTDGRCCYIELLTDWRAPGTAQKTNGGVAARGRGLWAYRAPRSTVRKLLRRTERARGRTAIMVLPPQRRQRSSPLSRPLQC